MRRRIATVVAAVGIGVVGLAGCFRAPNYGESPAAYACAHFGTWNAKAGACYGFPASRDAAALCSADVVKYFGTPVAIANAHCKYGST